MQFLLQETIHHDTPEHVPGTPNVDHIQLGNHLRSDKAQEARYAAMNMLKPQREKYEFSKRRQKQTAKLDSVEYSQEKPHFLLIRKLSNWDLAGRVRS